MTGTGLRFESIHEIRFAEADARARHRARGEKGQQQ
jgi:hypothetical protein